MNFFQTKGFTLCGVGILFFVLSNSPANAQYSMPFANNVDFSGMIEQQISLSSEGEGVQKFQTIFELRMELELSEDARLTAIGRIRADTETEIGFKGGNRHVDVELREFYVDADWAGVYWRLGKQQIVWGQADGLRVLDVINPLEYREFILPEFEENRIPLWIANAEIPINGDWTAQLLLIPDQTYDELAQSDSAFSMRSPQVVPKIPEGTPVNIRSVKKPNRVLKDADAGARLSAFLGGWDVSLNYLYHYQDQAVLFRQVAELGVTVSPAYERTHLTGASFSNVFGDTTFRSEVGYSSERYFLSNDRSDEDGVSSSGEISYVIGVDYQGWRDWFVSGQLFQSIVLDSSSGMARDKVETSATFLARRYFMNESLEAEALLIQNINRGDGVLQVSLEYQWSTNVRLMLGADVFFGSSAGLFGQFDKNDRLSLGMEVGF